MRSVGTLNAGQLLAVAASMAGPVGSRRVLETILGKLKQKPERDGIIPDKTIARRGRRQLALMKAAISGGVRFYPHTHGENPQTSTRPARRRAELGRV